MASGAEFSFPTGLLKKAEEIEKKIEGIVNKIRKVEEHNLNKILGAFRKHRITESHFYGTTGYGFHDSGRETLDKAAADILGAESAVVRWQIVSGTHAISAVIFGNLRPGDEILCATGSPYDTLHPVLGMRGEWKGNIGEWGIGVREVPLDDNGLPRGGDIAEAISEKTRMVFIQRSCGYTWRPSLSTGLIGELIVAVRAKKQGVIILVDNCYGEMVEEIEPTDLGADAMAGSLIKNLGGAIAPTGGYIAGRKEIVERAAIHLTAPGIGTEEGATLGLNRLLFQGIFFSPHIISQALQGAVFAASLFEEMGFEVKPRFSDPRCDIIQGIKLGSPAALKAFCKGIQKASPVDSFATPEECSMPGYRDPIIMAGGTFVQGSSIELSADGPIREPFAVYLQGGVSYSHIKLGVFSAVEELKKEGFIGENYFKKT